MAGACAEGWILSALASPPEQASPRARSIDPGYGTAWKDDLSSLRATTKRHRRSLSLDPEVTEFELGDADEWIVLASDGVWEFITSSEASATCCFYMPAQWRTARPKRAAGE